MTTSPAASAVHKRSTASGGNRNNPGMALAIIAVCQLMIVLDVTVVNIALPELQGDLEFSATGLAWVLNAYTLTFGGLLLLGGRAGDILGRRRVFMAGIALFSAASLACGLAGSDTFLLIARAVQGIGGAIAAPTALSLITTNFEDGPARNRALALFMAVSGSGSAIGLIVGGMLTSWASWRWVFFINVPIGLAALLLAPRFIRESGRQPGRFDMAGALTSTAGMALLVYGFMRAATDGWSDGLTLASFAGSAVLLLVFVVVEARARQPITPLNLFAHRNRSAAYVIMLMIMASMIGMFFFLIQFVQEVLGFSALRSGFAFLHTAVALMVAAQVASTLVSRIGPKPLLIAGGALTTAGMLWLTQVSADSSFAGAILGPTLLYGAGSGLLFATLAMVAVSGVRPEEAGATSSLLNVMQPVGGSLGLAILTTVFATAARETTPPAGADPLTAAHHIMAEGASDAFWVAAAFTGVALVAAFFVRGVPHPEGPVAPGAGPTP